MTDPIKTGTGATISIGTTASAETQSQFEADTYQEVGDVEEIGEFGDQRASVQFAALKDGRVRKGRGTADAGEVPLRYAHRTADVGQDAIKAAYEAESHAADEFNFKVMLNDQITPSTGNPTTFYFRAKVMGRRVQSVSNDGVVRAVATLAINSPVIEVDAT